MNPTKEPAIIEIGKVLEDPIPLLNSLVYSSYAANRGYGMSHEKLQSIGIGNELMKEKYEKSIQK